MTARAIRHPGEQRWETRLLAVVTLALVALGVVVCYAAGTYSDVWATEARQQVYGAILGGGVFLIAARLDYRLYRRVARPMFYATLAALIVIAVVAILWPRSEGPALVTRFVPYTNGAHRWIQVPFLKIQISEVARFTMSVMVATLAAELGTRVRSFRAGFIPLLLPVAITAVLVAPQPNLSMAILLGLTGVSVAFVAGIRFGPLMLTAVVGVTAVVMLIRTSPERLDRYATFTQPPLECVTGEQVCNSMIGVGTGGAFGVGLGRGTQKLEHMQFGFSDFILSVFAEEWGFLGVVVLTLCFIIYCWMGFRIALTTTDPFGRALAVGLTSMIAIAALMHAAVGMSLMPPTGLTLPFISAGRVSLIISLLSTGVLVSIGQRRGKLR